MELFRYGWWLILIIKDDVRSPYMVARYVKLFYSSVFFGVPFQLVVSPKLKHSYQVVTVRKAKVNLLNLARIANVFEILNPNLREQALQWIAQLCSDSESDFLERWVFGKWDLVNGQEHHEIPSNYIKFAKTTRDSLSFYAGCWQEMKGKAYLFHPEICRHYLVLKILKQGIFHEKINWLYRMGKIVLNIS